MSRRRKVVLTIIPTLLLFGLLLLAACSQGLDFQPPENGQSQEETTQETMPSPGTNASPGDRADDASVPSAGGATGDTTPPAGDAAQKVAPWSDPEDYEYYYNILPISGSDIEVKKVLRHQIIPQAVKSLLATFPKTFGYLEDWAIGFGLEFYDMGSDNNDTEASFQLVAGFGADASKAADATYEMKINSTSSSINAYEGGVLAAENRPSLEILCIHELMHAMMYETLTCGMSGYTPHGEEVDSFPIWFKEGTAEAACGGRLWRTLIQVDESQQKYTVEKIKETLIRQTLTAEDTTSQYTVGWFAVMYLAYLTNGGKSVNPIALADGLDTFLYKIHSGTSLSDAIKDVSKEKYSSQKDFEEKFPSDDEAADFILKLIQEVDDGQGSLVAKDYASKDLLPDENHETMLFWVHFDRPYSFLNKYGNALDGYEVYEGGAATYTGVPGAAVNPPTPEVLE